MAVKHPPAREEKHVYFAITEAVQLLDATKVAVYKRYSVKNIKVRVIYSQDVPGFVIERNGGPRYVNAVDLASHIQIRYRYDAPWTSKVKSMPDNLLDGES